MMAITDKELLCIHNDFTLYPVRMQTLISYIIHNTILISNGTHSFDNLLKYIHVPIPIYTITMNEPVLITIQVNTRVRTFPYNKHCHSFVDFYVHHFTSSSRPQEPAIRIYT